MESAGDKDAGTENNPEQMEDKQNYKICQGDNSAIGPEPLIPNEPKPEPRVLGRVRDTAVPAEPLVTEQGSIRVDSDPEQTYPKVVGVYYIDGTGFSPLTQNDGTLSPHRHIYYPGSEFCEVIGPGEKSGQREIVQSEDEGSTEDVTSAQSSDSDSEDLDGSDIIESRATIGLDSKGFKSLNITIKLNLSDIVRQPRKRHSPERVQRIRRKTRGSRKIRLFIVYR